MQLEMNAGFQEDWEHKGHFAPLVFTELAEQRGEQSGKGPSVGWENSGSV